MTQSKTYVLPVIIVSQFCGTSLWFAGNAVLPRLQLIYSWAPEFLGYLTSSIQLGFIFGTLIFAVIGITDRLSPSLVFCLSSLAAALSNALSLVDISSFSLLLGSRFLTGFFLAGIYPVGMKIAADWNEGSLGNWMGALVGALVLGTSLPHLLKIMPSFLQASTVLIAVSALAASGGILLFLVVRNGPYRKASARFSFFDIQRIFKLPAFRTPVFGYFGHMWELYAFWAFVPWALTFYNTLHHSTLSVPLFSFLSIGSGAIGCLVGGFISMRLGSKRVAIIALISSGLCCLLSPLFWSTSEWLFILIMLFWGLMVVADSPQFSSLFASFAPPEVRGSAITIVTCIGFGITIISIQLLTILQHRISANLLLLTLAPGPILGIFAMYRSSNSK